MWEHMTAGTSTVHFNKTSLLILTKLKLNILFLTSLRLITCDIAYTLPSPMTEQQTHSVASEMTGNDAGLSNFVEQEESSFMESPKSGSSEWTDEKHSLYLKSMEASFIDHLYNSLDIRDWQIENKCSSDPTSFRKIHASHHCSSGQFKVLQHGFWSRAEFRRENLVHSEANRPNVPLSINPWIQHFKYRNKQEATESLEKPALTNCSKTEVIDQNFVEEDSGIHMMNTTCSKKRKTTYAAPISSNDLVDASYGHVS